MKKLQAAMKESSLRRQSFKLTQVAYKVGSYFKGCHQCGEFHLEEVGNRLVKRYDSGYNVYRSYSPNLTHWTYWCYECGARDTGAWENATDIGDDAIRGTRSAIAEQKYRLLRKRLALGKAAVAANKAAVAAVKDPLRTEEIQKLREELARLELLLKGVK